MPEAVKLSSLAGSYKLRQQALSEHVAKRLIWLFAINVIGTVVLTLFLAGIDATFIWNGKISPEQRLISEKVFMTIVGATTVQLGAGVIAIVTALFKQPESDISDTESDN